MGKKKIIIITAICLTLLALYYYNGGGAFTGKAVYSNNLELEIPSEYRHITPGGKIWFTSKITTLGNLERRDITLKYTLLDSSQKVVTSRSETMAIETQASFIGSLDIPLESQLGQHELIVELEESGNVLARGSSKVEIREIEEDNFLKDNLLVILSFFCLIILIILFYLLKPLILTIFKRKALSLKVKKTIQEKIKNNSITKEELKNSKLSSTAKLPKPREEKIF
jgi:hypothetical protein